MYALSHGCDTRSTKTTLCEQSPLFNYPDYTYSPYSASISPSISCSRSIRTYHPTDTNTLHPQLIAKSRKVSFPYLMLFSVNTRYLNDCSASRALLACAEAVSSCPAVSGGLPHHLFGASEWTVLPGADHPLGAYLDAPGPSCVYGSGRYGCCSFGASSLSLCVDGSS